MAQINPFIGSIVQAPGVGRQQATEKDVQLKRSAEKRKNAGQPGDRFEHAVESAEELAAIHDEQKENPNKKRQQHAHHKDNPKADDEDGEPGLDLTA